MTLENAQNLANIYENAAKYGNMLYLDLPNQEALETLFSCPLLSLELLDKYGCDFIQPAVEGDLTIRELSRLLLDSMVWLMKPRCVQEWDKLLKENCERYSANIHELER